MKYHSRISERHEYLPIVVSILGKPGVVWPYHLILSAMTDVLNRIWYGTSWRNWTNLQKLQQTATGEFWSENVLAGNNDGWNVAFQYTKYWAYDSFEGRLLKTDAQQNLISKFARRLSEQYNNLKDLVLVDKIHITFDFMVLNRFQHCVY